MCMCFQISSIFLLGRQEEEDAHFAEKLKVEGTTIDDTDADCEEDEEDDQEDDEMEGG